MGITIPLSIHKVIDSGADLDSSLPHFRFGITDQEQEIKGLRVLIITLPECHFQGI